MEYVHMYIWQDIDLKEKDVKSIIITPVPESKYNPTFEN